MSCRHLLLLLFLHSELLLSVESNRVYVNYGAKHHRLKISDGESAPALLERARERMHIPDHEVVVLTDEQGCALQNNILLNDGMSLRILTRDEANIQKCDARLMSGHQTSGTAAGSRMASKEVEEGESWAEGVITVHNRFQGNIQLYNEAVTAFFKKKDCAPLLGHPARSYADVGECALLAGHLGEAYGMLQRAIQGDGKVLPQQQPAKVHYHMALAYARLGMHQAAEASFYQSVKAGGRGPVLVDLSALLLERAHLEAAKRPKPPQGKVEQEMEALCAGNGYRCHSTGLTTHKIWKRDGVPLEMVKQAGISPLESNLNNPTPRHLY